MRPTAQYQSALRFPLNGMLATEANVRVLRVLAGVTSAISAPELAKRAQLQRSSVHRAVRTLEETGIVEYVGTAPHNQIALRDRSSLAKAVRQLFQSEQSRYDDLLRALKKAADTINPPPLAVWIEGPVAEGKASGEVSVWAMGTEEQKLDVIAKDFMSEKRLKPLGFIKKA